MGPPSSVAACTEFFKQQRQEIILNGHLPNCIGPPIFLYHEVFSKFSSDFNNESLDLSDGLCAWSSKLIKDMANEHINEDSCKNAFINHITEFIGKLIEVKIEDGSSNDGMLLVETACGENGLQIIHEIKNEIGEGGRSNNSSNSFIFKVLGPRTDNDVTVQFTYEDWLTEDKSKLLFKGKTYDGCEIVIKFTQRYNTANITKEEYNDVLKNIQEAIDTLHTNDIVFGDLCSSNTMIEKVHGKLQVMLIDFGWAGIHQKDRYTPIMNPEIKWASGAEGNTLMHKDHDLYWLEILKKKYEY
ncbi:12815_t:CDS:2 [Entrophospora sp. SA101]|nr:12815_t:CDS:2 [Entrophospora sp. SA101]CAJ0842309.1 15271_t:CDS:2 [Entrophospora sp. SA101]CAJ0875806.1 10854_t:CDS:2 [Entrophospora sp. SA101]CAJ0900858.1 16741_t:CDS:2 [Entrophospora sp. SA101]CAJ0925856.1 3591_t:CDS:2 [Entrophospora sp. SA101]